MLNFISDIFGCDLNNIFNQMVVAWWDSGVFCWFLRNPFCLIQLNSPVCLPTICLSKIFLVVVPKFVFLKVFFVNHFILFKLIIFPNGLDSSLPELSAVCHSLTNFIMISSRKLITKLMFSLLPLLDFASLFGWSFSFYHWVLGNKYT